MFYRKSTKSFVRFIPGGNTEIFLFDTNAQPRQRQSIVSIPPPRRPIGGRMFLNPKYS